MVEIPVKAESISKFDPVEGTITLLPPLPGVAVNWFRLNPYFGLVSAVPTVANPDTDLSCQYFNTPVVWL